MFQSQLAWRRVTLLVAVLAGSSTARAAQLASDNASNAAYQDGWQTGDNGGLGFGPWQITSSGGLAGIGSSTANGDAQPPAGDIDSAGGRAWSLASARSTFGGVTAVRPLVGSLAVGQTVSFDIDGICDTANADNFNVILGNAAGGRWGLTVHEAGTHMGDGKTAGGVLATGDTREGMHIEFTLTGPDMFTASLRVLDGRDPVVVGGTLDGVAGSGIDGITFGVLPGIGRVDPFYLNNLAVTPEPGAGMLALAGGLVLARRRRREWVQRFIVVRPSRLLS